MNKQHLHIYIISEDPIFIRLLEVMFEHFTDAPIVEKFYSFADIKDLDNTHAPDVILVDDIVRGAASFEVLSFLRFNRRIISPICFFSDDVFDIVIKAIDRGASFFYKKPFNPKIVVEDIIDNLPKSKIESPEPILIQETQMIV